MAPLDVTGLPPVSANAPAGEDLELDPQFGELERAAQGKPEVQYGNTIEPPVPPDWKLAAATAEALMERTHDLRVLVHLAIARLHLTGLPGYAEAVRLIRLQLDDHWKDVHPQLDPEDDNDPMQRSNAVLRLQDPVLVLRRMRDVTLVSTVRTGPVSWRDLAIASGTIEPEPDREKMNEAKLAAAFEGTDKEGLAAVRDAVDSLLQDVPAISTAFDRNAGVGTGPDYADLLKLVRDIQREMKRFEKVGAAPIVEPDGEEAPAADAAAAPASRAEAPVGRGFASIQAITALTKREDALHALQLASAYFRTQEPSSPLPLLIDRAMRLAVMEFMDILRELAPDGVRQVQVIAGSESA